MNLYLRMRTLKLSQGREAIVDDVTAQELGGRKYYFANVGYAARTSRKLGKRTEHYLHREVFELFFGPIPKGYEIDHVNGDDKLDNRIENLRLATRSQNTMNRGPHADSISGLKGILWDKRWKKWCARIMFQGKSIHVGKFTCPKEAARAYNEKALELFGEFAWLNPID